MQGGKGTHCTSIPVGRSELLSFKYASVALSRKWNMGVYFLPLMCKVGIKSVWSMIKRISYSQAPYFDLHTTTNASKFWAAFKGRLTVTVLLVESIIAYHWLSLHFMLFFSQTCRRAAYLCIKRKAFISCSTTLSVSGLYIN